MKKEIVEYKTYIKNGQTVLVDLLDYFVYETSMYLYYKNYFSLINKKYFSSNKEIQGVVSSFWKNSHIQICSELFSAPETWLIDNGYIKYVKPVKIKKLITKKIDTNDK